MIGEGRGKRGEGRGRGDRGEGGGERGEGRGERGEGRGEIELKWYPNAHTTHIPHHWAELVSSSCPRASSVLEREHQSCSSAWRDGRGATHTWERERERERW